MGEPVYWIGQLWKKEAQITIIPYHSALVSK